MSNTEKLISELKNRKEVKNAKKYEGQSERIKAEFHKKEHTYPAINQMRKKNWEVEATGINGDRIIFSELPPK